jgi:branched-chain amino acid aminotransferase
VPYCRSWIFVPLIHDFVCCWKSDFLMNLVLLTGLIHNEREGIMSFNDAKWVWMNGAYLPWDKANIHVSAHALHYGSGVFEGIRCYDTIEGPALFRIDDHVERFFSSAHTHGMEIPYTAEQLTDATAELTRRNEFSNCYVRPICFRGSRSLSVDPKSCPVEVAILAWPWAPMHGAESISRGIQVCISPWKKFHSDMMPTTAKASGQYVNSMLALRDALDRGYKEALLLDVDGYLAEAASENLFLVRNGSLWTNDERYSILLGITRDSIIQIARDLGYTVNIGALTVEDLRNSDEVFLTGTAAEVVPVCQVDGENISDGQCGVVTRHIQEQFKKIVSGENPDYRRWLHLVTKAAALTA